VALLLEVIAGHDARDAASLPVGRRCFDTTPGRLDGIRIAFTLDLGFAAVSPDVRRAFANAVEVFTDLGAELQADDPGLDPEVLERTIRPIAYTEQAAAVMERDAQALARSDRDYQELIARGRNYRGIEYVEALHRRTMLRGQFLKLFQRAQALITPTVSVTAFAAGTLGVKKIEDRAVDPHLGWSPFSWPINLAGLPAATIPCGFDRDGLPIGLQIVAPWLEEGLIFRLAAAFEATGISSGRWPTFVSA
jgi:aspartyl-tRNA(Asn)/glutamyl-tRNA(Gln) amidotransferase subunit A